jgi:hypothetical protein
MRNITHQPKGASLERIEELRELVTTTPDWVPHIRPTCGASGAQGQDFSGLLREVALRDDVPPWLEELLDQAAERLDQAEEEYLEVAAKHDALMKVRYGASDFADTWAADLHDCPDPVSQAEYDELVGAIREVDQIINQYK